MFIQGAQAACWLEISVWEGPALFPLTHTNLKKITKPSAIPSTAENGTAVGGRGALAEGKQWKVKRVTKPASVAERARQDMLPCQTAPKTNGKGTAGESHCKQLGTVLKPFLAHPLRLFSKKTVQHRSTVWFNIILIDSFWLRPAWGTALCARSDLPLIVDKNREAPVPSCALESDSLGLQPS